MKFFLSIQDFLSIRRAGGRAQSECSGRNAPFFPIVSSYYFFSFEMIRMERGNLVYLYAQGMQGGIKNMQLKRFKLVAIGDPRSFRRKIGYILNRVAIVKIMLVLGYYRWRVAKGLLFPTAQVWEGNKII